MIFDTFDRIKISSYVDYFNLHYQCQQRSHWQVAPVNVIFADAGGKCRGLMTVEVSC